MVLAGSTVGCARSGPTKLAGELVIAPCIHDERLRELVEVAAHGVDDVRAEAHPMHAAMRQAIPLEDHFLVAPTLEALEQAVQRVLETSGHLQLRDGERMLYAAIEGGEGGGQEVHWEGGGQQVAKTAWRTHLVDMGSALHIRDIEGAQIRRDEEDGWPRLRIRLAPAQGDAFHRLSAKQVGRMIVLLHEGEVLSSPVVAEPIPGHEIHVMAPRIQAPTPAEAEALLKGLLSPS
jgi:preprotein translocase subunit SecD